MRNCERKGRIYCCDVARLTGILLCSSDLKQVFEEWKDRRKGRDCRYFGNYFSLQRRVKICLIEKKRNTEGSGFAWQRKAVRVDASVVQKIV